MYTFLALHLGNAEDDEVSPNVESVEQRWVKPVFELIHEGSIEGRLEVIVPGGNGEDEALSWRQRRRERSARLTAPTRVSPPVPHHHTATVSMCRE